MERIGWAVFNAITKAQVFLYQRSGGRFATSFRGAPVCLVDNVGRKSGQKRTTPLIYIEDGGAVVIVASKGGHPSHPAWWLNLRDNPETTVQVKAEKRSVRAREATDEERDRLWPRLVDVYAPYADYQEKTERKIPVVLLEPAAA